jgi:protein TonB
VRIAVSLVEAPPAAEPFPAAERAVRKPAPAPAEEMIEEQTIQEVPAEKQATPTSEAPRTVETQIVEQAQSSGAPKAEAPAAEQRPVAERAAAPAQPGAEVAAYAAILSTLRSRIVEEIRYPPLARVKGWQGTVVVALRLDAAGSLLQAVVRRSSGYEVLDRAASALMKKVTPVKNPLELPLTIEIPIVYELK